MTETHRLPQNLSPRGGHSHESPAQQGHFTQWTASQTEAPGQDTHLDTCLQVWRRLRTVELCRAQMIAWQDAQFSRRWHSWEGEHGGWGSWSLSTPSGLTAKTE